MMRTIRTVLAGGTLLVLAACGQTPTGAEAVAPRYGFTLGGGNVTGGGPSDGTSVQSAATTTTCEERGGFTFGGGNVAGPTEPCKEELNP